MRDALAQQRQGLLAKIHIAKKDMGLTDDQYEAMLAGMKVTSAKDLTILQMEKLVQYLKHYGWKPSKIKRKTPDRENTRLDALRRRCVELAKEIENGERRLAGLAMTICGVSSLTWCRDINKLERLLAVIGKIKEEGHDVKRRD